MRLVDIRSTHPEQGLVAVLIEEGGPAMLAIPVTARQGLALRAHRVGRGPTWAGLIDDAVRALGARILGLALDVDEDARITAALRLRPPGRAPVAGDGPVGVPCDPGDGMVVACTRALEMSASAQLVRLRGVDLGGGMAVGAPPGWFEEPGARPDPPESPESQHGPDSPCDTRDA